MPFDPFRMAMYLYEGGRTESQVAAELRARFPAFTAAGALYVARQTGRGQVRTAWGEFPAGQPIGIRRRDIPVVSVIPYLTIEYRLHAWISHHGQRYGREVELVVRSNAMLTPEQLSEEARRLWSEIHRGPPDAPHRERFRPGAEWGGVQRLDWMHQGPYMGNPG